VIFWGFAGVYWSTQNAGEIKNAHQVKSQTIIMIGALLFGLVFLMPLAFFLQRTVGSSFLSAAGYLFFTGNSAYPIPIAPYMSLFAFVLNSNPIFVLFVIFFNFLWLIYANTNGPLAGARFFLAAAFDRTLPAKFGDVSDRFHVPVFALGVFTLLTIVLAALYLFVPGFGTITLDLIFGSVIMQFFSMISAVLLPIRKKETYATSPISKYKVAGIPLISITGAIGAVLLGWLAYLYATIDGLGVNSPTSALFLVGVYGSGFAIYLLAVLYRRRQGIDVNLAFREIPPE
jgi:amino acid transporter